MTATPAANLQNHSKTVILKDGSALRLRPLRSQDEEQLLDFFQRLSHHTVHLRFHHVLTQMSREEAKRFCRIDHENIFAIVATIGEAPEERIIAVARYARLPKRDTAEAAFVVEDSYHGRGIGTHLLEELAATARLQGICRFEAEILAENRNMLKVLKDSGFKTSQRIQFGVSTVSVDIAPTEVAEERLAERERVATIASITPNAIGTHSSARRDSAPITYVSSAATSLVQPTRPSFNFVK